jgi:threonine dehydrogenase-like Zn-dependent dehydrogenase
MKEVYDRAMTLVEHGQVDVRSLVTHHFPLEKIGEAFDLLINYRDGVIKTIIAM